MKYSMLTLAWGTLSDCAFGSRVILGQWASLRHKKRSKHRKLTFFVVLHHLSTIPRETAATLVQIPARCWVNLRTRNPTSFRANLLAASGLYFRISCLRTSKPVRKSRNASAPNTRYRARLKNCVSCDSIERCLITSAVLAGSSSTGETWASKKKG